MDILKMGAELLSQKLGANADTIMPALSALLGDGEGNVDLAGLATKMMSSGDLGGVVSSWLGDGENKNISPEWVTSLLGEGKLAEFAAKIGVDTGAAASGLADVLPQMVDKASSGGSLLESAGGVGGLMGMAKKFF
ncbi:MAG: DUF937 domain-containing protein [Gammaproteobacteria bacterium]|uniref:YidB family protein n=1 Tax=Pseudomaricurvus alcaniphilus TaxID=1166482 RepID=UPI00140BD64A|nr:YidB family protein [Pseudomaricurvus alcaniphilus]MBR9912944.1 DUF937 domain-containing protein [Gammaproteobacteria bacterium]NHN39487.1 DUF937 domain-containing protein [Pseudomaricurvus alcaniphilus]